MTAMVMGMGMGMGRGLDPLQGQWTCQCGFRNRDMNQVCGGNGPMGCKTPKPKGAAGAAGPGAVPLAFQAAPQQAMPSVSYAPVRQGKGAMVARTTPYGFGGKGLQGLQALQALQGLPLQFDFGLGLAGAVPAAMPGANKAFGTWTCRCGFSNRASNMVCGGGGDLGCKAAKEWICGSCMFVNRNSNAVCGGISGALGCKAPNPEGQPAGVAARPASQWACDCGFMNKALNSVCGGSGPLGCKLPRPEAEATEPTLTEPVKIEAAA